ncbi:hypothetical protein CC80DRAFT_373558, partial [Byssothecium circinans]
TPNTDEDASAELDPLIAQTVQKIADVLNHLKRELDDRDGVSVTARGKFELAVGSQEFEIGIVSSDDGDHFPLSVKATLQANKSATNEKSLTTLTDGKRARSDSDAELENEIVSRKRRQLEEGKPLYPHQSTFQEIPEEDGMSFISKEDLREIMSRLRDDIQEDTSECVNHVQKLLRRFKQEWHEKNQRDQELASTQPRPPFRNSISTQDAAFPTLGEEKDSQDTSLQHVIRQEAKIVSNQIRWLEECRRVASDSHDKREETWRTTSAGFHDRSRQDRETFQNRMLHESGMHTQTLNQILNEVKSIGLHTQSMKWELPSSLSGPAYPPQPVAPACPSQTHPKAP